MECCQLRKLPTQRNGRIEEATASTRHGRNIVVTASHRQVNLMIPRCRYTTEETYRTLLTRVLASGQRSRVTNCREIREVEIATIVIPVTHILMVHLITQNNVQAPLLITTKTTIKVNGKQVIEDIVLCTVIPDITTCQSCGTAHLMNITIVGSPDIQTGLLTEFQGHVVTPI